MKESNEKKEIPLVDSIKKIVNSPFSVYPSLDFKNGFSEIKTYWLKFNYRF